jgi:(E)-4-hydroxy-3-methylbut-2-enyl-diphosphate synthase
VQAYRLLAQKLTDEGMSFPLHLGVTEAGGGDEGIINRLLALEPAQRTG